MREAPNKRIFSVELRVHSVELRVPTCLRCFPGAPALQGIPDPSQCLRSCDRVAWHGKLPVQALRFQEPGNDLRPRCAEVEAGRQAARGADALGSVGIHHDIEFRLGVDVGLGAFGLPSDRAAAGSGGAGSGGTISLNQ